MVKTAKHKSTLTNGRDSKAVPKFENWHCRVYPKDFTYPAWRDLSKTATDVALVCRAKHDHAAHCGKKNGSGRPIFEFTATEAESEFRITRPTFSKAIHDLLNIGFLEIERHGGTLDGKGISALYRLSEEWKKRGRRPRDTTNIMKARNARKPREHG